MNAKDFRFLDLDYAHEWDLQETAQRLKTDFTKGLRDADAAGRFAEYGPNELRDRGPKKPWRIFREQLTGAIVVLLILAAAVSAVLGDYKNALAIAAIVIFNAFFGFAQEYKAEKAMTALKKIAVPRVQVFRSGEQRLLSARELVPGDVILLETGNLVPADCRVIEASNLRTQEAALTGESEPVEKTSGRLSGNLPVADRRNLVFMGTIVTYGRGKAAVIRTGMKTELGRIAGLIEKAGAGETTPLQKRLDRLGQQLAWVALAIVSVVFILGLFRGEDLKLMFMTAVSLAVAAVPEGLAAVVTIALALGAQKMLRRSALIRKLPAVETLGSVTVICSDKTGTLTENRMRVRVLMTGRERLELTGPPDPNKLSPAFKFLLTAGVLCNDAVLEDSSKTAGEIKAIGDPTDAALVTAAARFGLWKNELENSFPRVSEIPFDAHRKKMTTVHQMKVLPPLHPAFDAPYGAIVKGALDSLLSECTQIGLDDRTETLTEDGRRQIHAANENLAKDGMRILGVAFRPLESLTLKKEDWEKNLIYLGIAAMRDPVRPEARQSVEMCRNAGIRAVMITGDHPLTAQAIGNQLGISGEEILTGRDLEKMTAEDLAQKVEKVSVYARVSPEHKLKIVEALKKRGEIVAMTGDGVNDAPALKKADIGIAMGITGTDVSKEAADMVLLDDNFSTIVAAVEEGRVIYDNIRKFIKYLMTTNSAEICVMLAAPFLGMPLPLIPLQILWINLVSDGPLALALGVEPAERHIMKRRPFPPDQNIFSRGMIRHIFWVGILITVLSLGAAYFYWRKGHPGWQTLLFTTLPLAQMGQALGIRSHRDSLFKTGLLSNKPFLAALLCTVLLQMAVVYVPFLQEIFSTVALSWRELAISFGLSGIVLLAVETEKWMIRRKRRFPSDRMEPQEG